MTTDNRTTELREKLDERGVEYEADDRKTYAYTYWGDWAYCEPLDAKPGTLGAQCELMLIPATPEQAIAATLGSEREAKLIQAMEDVLRHSTDTVWVGEAETLVDRMVSLGIYEHDVYEGARPWEVGR